VLDGGAWSGAVGVGIEMESCMFWAPSMAPGRADPWRARD
jgi:hypothetical protein